MTEQNKQLFNLTYIKSNRNKILFISGIAIILAIFLLIVIENKKNVQENDLRKSLVANIQFKGKVINTEIIDRYGKKYLILCIALDYSNTNNIYIFNDLCALKIKNGIATIPGGLFEQNIIPTYVEINMNNSLKNKIYFQNGEVQEYELGLGSGGLKEKDMNLCN